ncbi:meiotic recombination [Arachnomyces sp. PD_36]|nr:meiotic recombination [Arachnomyces sp. PD_36]
MPSTNAADTIRILVSTDNHVGYNERDPIRGDDSWKSFHEVMCLATKHDVDMVLLAGDLFHENKPSRKSMYQVMRSLRMNCYGDRPCELEMLSDASENFQGAFNHVNYEDLDINVALPVFSIHGNHDDPSGEGHLAALDLLQVSGLVNYYGRTPEADNIQIKPVLLQKGRTKLALYGMSNVRDERLFRTFRDGKVKFFQPSTQKSDWFNLMSVHQNHHAHTETGYLPENFLPDFMDLVIWGHEHECLIDPRLNPETNFHVMQPGSSVATSLVPGEAVPKHVSILSITGREFKTENIRLKSVRPFVMREISLHEEKSLQKLARKDNNRTEITRYLMSVVDELIEEAKAEWLETQQDEEQDEEVEVPLPLVRLRVETSAPDGGSFDTENPQRFSNRFVGKVANVNDVVQFHRKKKAGSALSKDNIDVPDESLSSGLASLDTVKVEKLVREFLTAQSLTILPQNSFGDAVSQFVDKDDKHAMEMFVNESLENQIKHLLALDRDPDNEMDYDDEEGQSSLQEAMDKYRNQLEEMFSKGAARKRGGKKRFKPRPDGWDSEFDGVWEDQPGALIHSDHEGGDQDEEEGNSRTTAARARTTTSASTRGRRGAARGGRAASTATSTRGGRTAAASTKRTAAPATTSRSRRQQQHVISDDEDADEDIIMAHEVSEDDDDEVEVQASDDDSDSLFVKQPAAKAKPKAPAAAPPTRSAPSRSTRNAAPPASLATSQRTSRTTRPSPAPSSATLGASASSRKPPARAKKLTQSTLNMGGASQNPSQSQARSSRSGVAGSTGTGTRARTTRSMSVLSDGIEDDDEDAFEPAPPSMAAKRRR